MRVGIRSMLSFPHPPHVFVPVLRARRLPLDFAVRPPHIFAHPLLDAAAQAAQNPIPARRHSEGERLLLS
jgi:hypothetical protein